MTALASERSDTAGPSDGAGRTPSIGVGGRYAIYALLILTTANFLNYMDRNIVSILAEEIKRDLSLTDGQVGMLFGTAFAVLFAVVGIPAGRLSDRVTRKRLLALGLVTWSVMTMFSGLAMAFVPLILARVGVGLGEATANPSSHSLLSDYFPSERRATAMGIYLVATYVGGGAALAIGGLFIDHWSTLCAAIPVGGACQVKSWQAAFFVAGLPGLIVAALVAGLREPPRKVDRSVSIGRFALTEIASSTPPFTLLSALKVGGAAGVGKNLILLAVVSVAGALTAFATGDYFQWGAVAFGAYAIGSWILGASKRDRPFFKLTFGCPTFVAALVGMCCAGVVGGSTVFWATPHALRTLGLSASDAGSRIGLVVALGSIIGVSLGGWLTDIWKRRDLRAPMWMTLCCLVFGAPIAAVMFLTRDPNIFLAAFFLYAGVSHAWAGGAAAFVQDMVLQRMRGAASACFSLVIILVTLAIGPYWVGRVSTATGSLGLGILGLHVLVPLAIVALLIAARRIRNDTPDARLARAAAAGEPA